MIGLEALWLVMCWTHNVHMCDSLGARGLLLGTLSLLGTYASLVSSVKKA